MPAVASKVLWTGCGDGNVRSFDIESGAELQRIAHPDEVRLGSGGGVRRRGQVLCFVAAFVVVVWRETFGLFDVAGACEEAAR